jgi:hypothetical protein
VVVCSSPPQDATRLELGCQPNVPPCSVRIAPIPHFEPFGSLNHQDVGYSRQDVALPFGSSPANRCVRQLPHSISVTRRQAEPQKGV